MTAAERAARTAEADALCARSYREAGGPGTGTALVAVGGYGRGELAPYSDLDVVLVHEDGADPGRLGQALWYPLWDSGRRLDHSVRSFSGTLETARTDLRAALGLLDLRHLAGDPHLALRLRTTLLAEWRSQARRRLPELAEMVRRRHELVGELAHASVPDLKEAAGGLRDAVVLKALVATWLVDVPHPELERSRQTLLDVRDVLHATTGRPTDRIAPESWADLASALELGDVDEAQRFVRARARRLAHLTRVTWRRVDELGRRPTRGPRRPVLRRLAAGVAASEGEVVLDGTVAPADDPVLLLRCAAEAAERDLLLSPATCARLGAESAGLPVPWPPEARHLLVRLLASGRGLLPVWETLDETGVLPLVLPEWERIRLLPHASAIHRFTVDRHVVETCVEAAALIRRVDRPDVLMLAALLHDIGKGELLDHSVAGEPIAVDVARRVGLDEDGVDLVGTLVRWHLLLPGLATSHDVQDPATAAALVSRVGSRQGLSLLAALTEADARATSGQAWSTWRAGLVGSLVRRATEALESPALPVVEPTEVPVPAELASGRWRASFAVDAADHGSEITVVARDRVGLLADVAAVLGLQRVPVLGARAWQQGTWGVSRWQTTTEGLDPAVLRLAFDAVVEGRAPVARRLGGGAAPRLDPVVVPHSGRSRDATVLEVRAEDRPGLLYSVLKALADLVVDVRSAHVDTIGPQAADVFYLQEHGAGLLSEERTASCAHAVRAALRGYSDPAARAEEPGEP